jgi:5-methylcytosine-specific restriction endonuclease McrA
MKKTLDRIWQEIICLIWKKCAKCGSTHNLAGHHIVKRRYLHTRWNIDNGICLCFTCHRFAEEHEEIFITWLRFHRPRSWYFWVNNKHPAIHRFPDWELKEVHKGLKEIKRTVLMGGL